jgi:hypothetical protein
MREDSTLDIHRGHHGFRFILWLIAEIVGGIVKDHRRLIVYFIKGDSFLEESESLKFAKSLQPHELEPSFFPEKVMFEFQNNKFCLKLHLLFMICKLLNQFKVFISLFF